MSDSRRNHTERPSGSSMFGRLVSTLTRGARPGVERHEPRVVPEDLGLKTLRQVYAQYAQIQNPIEKERQLYKLLPLFCKNCSRMKPQELVTKFPEAYEFAENVAFLFVRHVTQLAQTANTRAGATLLKYFEARGGGAADGSETGLVILRAICILANGPEHLVSSMMTSNLSAILVRCIHLFLDLPPPRHTHERERESGSPFMSVRSQASRSEPVDEEELDRNSEMTQRITLQRLIESVLNRLLRNTAAVEDLLRFGDLALLFGAISSPCPKHNKIWRKAAANCLMTICRRSLTGEVISFVHKKGCIGFCVRNIKLAVDQPPLELVEIFATIFCCLKDSSDFSQVLLEDFSCSGGYKLLYEYLLHLERTGTEDSREAERNMVLLISNNLVPAGFLSLEPTLSDGGPLQDPDFVIPVPQDGGSTLKNVDAFLVLQDAFLSSSSSHLGKSILDTILNVYRSDHANYFILDSFHTLSLFLEKLPHKNDDVQAHVFQVLEYVMIELNYVPSSELASIGLLLQKKDMPKTLSLALNFLVKLISHSTRYKNVFREVGVLTMLISALKAFTSDLRQQSQDKGSVVRGGVSSPSLPLEDLEGADEEYLFLLTECIRATVEGNLQNGRAFRDAGGTKCVLEMANYKKPRRMALRIVTQLILLEDGAVDFTPLLDLLNSAPQTAVGLKIEILHTVLGVFQLDSWKKSVFREVCGFHYLISVLASLIQSLAPRRTAPWIGVPRSDILQLVQLVFIVLTTAMQDDPANRMFFENSIRFDSFSAPLQLLGCFVKECDAFSPSNHHLPADADLHLGTYVSFDAEFKTWKPPQGDIDTESSVHSAAEIFRFLRDMALDIPSVQSRMLLQMPNKDADTYGSPMGTGNARGAPQAHLVHPGAVLCMVDLLPGINIDYSSTPTTPAYVAGQRLSDRPSLSTSGPSERLSSPKKELAVEEGEAENSVIESKSKDILFAKATLVEEITPHHPSLALQGGDVIPEIVIADSEQTSSLFPTPSADAAILLRAANSGEADGPECGDSDHDTELTGAEEQRLKDELASPVAEDEPGDRDDLVEDGCSMTPNDARKWCVFLQERVVSEIFLMAMSERNQQALCQVGLPQRMLQRCSAVLADDSHPLHQSLERTFERLSYQALVPSDFRNFLRLGNPLCCQINDIPIQQLEMEAAKMEGAQSEETLPVAGLGGMAGQTKEVSGAAVTPGAEPEGQGVNAEENARLNAVVDSSEKAVSEAVPEDHGKEEEEALRAKPTVDSELSPAASPYGGSLSLARIQSLVSMTTPRHGYQPGIIGIPPFVEFDLSIDGFGSLFLPSAFPQSIDQSIQAPHLHMVAATTGNTTGIGAGGERPFPPNSGLTFSTWMLFSRFPPDDPHPLPLLSLSQCFLSAGKQLKGFYCFRVYLNLAEETVTVTTHVPRGRQDSFSEEPSQPESAKEQRSNEATFPCPQLLQLQAWHHLTVVVSKTMRSRAKVTVYVDSVSVGSEKMNYIRLAQLADPINYLPYPSEATPFLINAHIGTHVTQRHVSPLVYRLGATFLFDDPMTSNNVKIMYKLGPSYFGSFQAPVLEYSVSTSLTPGVQGEPLNALISEDRAVFGLIPSHPVMKTVHELGKTYSGVDVATIARELSIKEGDDVTPVTFLHNASFHLSGPSRTLGAVICGYSGIRAFEPQPLRTLLSAVGGTSVVLGLVAMATTVDSLYASMKALVCIVGNNQVALKELERTGGFQVLGMLLRSKAHLINSNILHLTYTLVGTVNSEHENSYIPNPIAFRDLLADLAIWSQASEDIQRSLCNHFYDLLTHSSERVTNAEHMLNTKLISVLLFRLRDTRLSRPTVKAMCNVISALLSTRPTPEDIMRVGQLLATTLPHAPQPSERPISENTVCLYGNPAVEGDPLEDVDGFHGEGDSPESPLEDQGFDAHHRRDIVLRNMMLDVILSLLKTSSLDMNTQFAYQLCTSLGLDWVMLFLQANIHIETVTRALRILAQLLCDPILLQKFHEGDIFGDWTRGFDTLSPEMTKMLEGAVLNTFYPVKSVSQQLSLAGAKVLSSLLPHHQHSPQVYLLVFAILLGDSGCEVPFTASFDQEALDNIFHITSLSRMGREVRLCLDAAYVLLSMCRVLLHQDSPDPLSRNSALVLVKSLERLYRTLPQFADLARQQEFIEALAATLFLPVPSRPGRLKMMGGGDSEGDAQTNEYDEDGFVVLISPDSVSLSSQQQQPQSNDVATSAILQQDNAAVCSIVKLLRTIAVDGFTSTQVSAKDNAVCPVLELVLQATPAGVPLEMQQEYQTAVLYGIVEYLQAGNEDILVLFRGTSCAQSIEGLSVFCSRLVDKVWQGVYLKPSNGVYTFLLSLVEQARKQPGSLPLGDLQRSLNRIILYLVSSIPACDSEQKDLMNTLCLFSSQAHIIFDDTNFDIEFLECLTYRLLKIAFADTGRQVPGNSQLAGGYVPVVSMSMMKSGANRLWSKMLEYKREALEQFLSIELPAPKTTSTLVSEADQMGLAVSKQLAYSSMANLAFSKLQNCRALLTEHLEKAWEDYETCELSFPSPDTLTRSSEQRKSFLIPRRRKERDRLRSGNIENTVQEYVDTLCPLRILAAQKYHEILLKKHIRNSDYKLRFTASEWSRIEYELTRERGLWGPDNPSPLDKWMLDTVEGPFRMRKRMCRNHSFYRHYPYIGQSQLVKSKYQNPVSSHSQLYFHRAQLFRRSSLLTSPSFAGTQSHVPSFSSGRDSLMNVSIEYPSSVLSTTDASSSPSLSLTSSPSTVFSRSVLLNQLDTEDPVAQALNKMIEPEDKITSQFQCARLTGLDSRDGILLLGSTHFYVVEGVTFLKSGELIDIESAEQGSYNPVVPTHLHLSTIKKEGIAVPIGCIKWPYSTIREIHKRRYLLRHCALEVFSSDGRNHFLIFKQHERDKIYHKLLSVSKSSLAEGEYIAGAHPETNPEQAPGLFSILLTGEKSLPEKWANGEMSNFQYLMHLNTLAGRSYNDLMQYPVFPWVLADYTSETLDLINPKSFRDFSKPMGAQTPSRLSRFVERYKYFEDPTGENTPAYYYGTHYSSAMIVASYLIRMEPFTQHFIKLQGGHFDLPDRLFHSIPDAWRSTSEANMADIKELIPEFFYLSEFLVNNNHFDLGKKQSGEELNDIILPPWAKGDPKEFIRMHREALESDYVSAHLHEWIDLIFGYKQNGEEALKAHNVFHHLFYEGAVDIDTIKDPVKRNATISFIHNFGQMPKQIFRRPHRPRKVFTSPISAAVDTSSAPPPSVFDLRRVFYKNLVQLMPSREPIKEIRSEVSQVLLIGDKYMAAVDKNKVLLPPSYSRYFVWGFPDRSARIALLEGDRVTSTYEGLHQGRILCATASSENLLLTGGDSTVVCVWEMKSTGFKSERSRTQLHLAHTLHGHRAAVTCLTTSANYNLIISGSKDKTCILWDLNKFVFVSQLCGHNGPVTLTTINHLNGNIVSCTKSQIKLWTVNGTLLAEHTLMITGNFRLLCCSVSELFEWDKDNVIITGSSDGVVRMWALEYVKASAGAFTGTQSNLDHPIRKRAPTLIKKLQQTIKDSESWRQRRRRLLESQIDGEVEAGEDTDGVEEQEKPEREKEEDNKEADVEELETGEEALATGSRSNSEEEYVDSSGQFSVGTPPLSQLTTPFSPVAETIQKLDETPPGDGSEGGKEDVVPSEAELETRQSSQPVSLSTELGSTATSETCSKSESTLMPDSTGKPASEEGVGISRVSESNSTEDENLGAQVSSEEMESGDSGQEADGESQSAADEPSVPDHANVSGKEQETGSPHKETEAVSQAARYAQLMVESRKKSEELKARAGQWTRRLSLVHTLTMHTSFSRTDNGTPAAVTSICISRDHRRLFIGDSRGRIFSWSVTENVGGVMEHWLKDEAVDKCMKCEVDFTFTERKHHCRDCGKIFCAKCSAYESEIERLRITNKRVRVCADCYSRLVNDRLKNLC